MKQTAMALVLAVLAIVTPARAAHYTVKVECDLTKNIYLWHAHDLIRRNGAYLDWVLRAATSPVTFVLTPGAGWPQAQGDTITIGETFWTKYAAQGHPATDDDIWAAIVHEAAHTQDRSPAHGYGADGIHKVNEITNPAVAMREGWAEYQALAWNVEHRQLIADPQLDLRLERETAKAGVYRQVAGPTPAELQACEIIVVRTLQRLKEGLPDGSTKLEMAFAATNDGSVRTLRSLCAKLVALYPADAAAVGRILDPAPARGPVCSLLGVGTDR